MIDWIVNWWNAPVTVGHMLVVIWLVAIHLMWYIQKLKE